MLVLGEIVYLPGELFAAENARLVDLYLVAIFRIWRARPHAAAAGWRSVRRRQV